ncbi:MAG: type IX secretion system outer membrane channel protein PorV [Dysgonamonadaceae bacterium]|nr:type IX secretion system outer membrane channel protein PorV [Dysgonamonadaceae bacterium]
MNVIKFLTIIFLIICTTFIIKAADDDGTNAFNPVTVSVPSLTIAPDARGGGMGDIGVATEPDMSSQYWNPAKYAFAYSKAGVNLSYTPWLRNLVDDIDLVFLSGYYKLGDSDRQAIGASLRYFSLGSITITDRSGKELTRVSPYEMAVDAGFSIKTSETFSIAGTFRFIYSDMGTNIDGASDLQPGYALAADIAGYYNNYLMIGNNECLLGLGINVSNIGSKISYDGGNTTYFIPTNLRIGSSLLFPLDNYNTLSLNIDANKYLVPTQPLLPEGTEQEAERQTILEKYRSTGSIAGIFKSFSDAPGGAKEEFQEIMWSFGAEYAYDNKFFVRGGYFYENPYKGNRQYFSLGAGFKFMSFQLDAAYLISTVPSNPLDQTLRFSLTFDMDGLKSLMR